MKVLLVAYLTFCAGTLAFQMATSDFVLVCLYNGGACTSMAIKQTWHALTWPHYLLLT